MGGQQMALTAQVADNSSLYTLNPGYTYNNKYVGMIDCYVPTDPQTRYALHLTATAAAVGALFVGVEIELLTSTTFILNYIAGTIQSTGAVSTRVAAATGTFPFAAQYRIAWYTDRNGPNDTFWVNNVAHSIANLPTENVTRIHTADYIFAENTPANFAICSIWTSTDPLIDFNTFNAIRTSYPLQSPVYLGAGGYTQSGLVRPLYVHSYAPTIRNHANNDAVFTEAIPGSILYQKQNVRFKIA